MSDFTSCQQMGEIHSFQPKRKLRCWPCMETNCQHPTPIRARLLVLIAQNVEELVSNDEWLYAHGTKGQILLTMLSIATNIGPAVAKTSRDILVIIQCDYAIRKRLVSNLLGHITWMCSALVVAIDLHYLNLHYLTFFQNEWRQREDRNQWLVEIWCMSVTE